MTRLIVPDVARKDIRDIVMKLELIAGRGIALRFARNFDGLLELIERFPGTGSPRPQLGKAVRCSAVQPYLVFFEYMPDIDTTIVLRIIHGRRKITRKLIRQT